MGHQIVRGDTIAIFFVDLKRDDITGIVPSPDDLVCISDGSVSLLAETRGTLSRIQDLYDADVLGFNYFSNAFQKKKGYFYAVRTFDGEEAVTALDTGEFPLVTGCIAIKARFLPEDWRSVLYRAVLEDILSKSRTVCYYDEPLAVVKDGKEGLFTTPEKEHDLPESEYAPLPHPQKKVPITIGICAYNEEKNIERTIRSIYRQKCQVCEITDVLVVSSGSTDRTDEIVQSLSEELGTVKLIPQEKREGKNSAINLLFQNKRTEIMVFLNADNVFENTESLDRLIEPLLDPSVGMVGGHPLPTNRNDGPAGYTVQLMWKMHHYVAVQIPKTGELIAFRDIGTRLPTDMQSDEDILRMELEAKGYRTVYAPLATILNHGPDTVMDYIKQRTRVNIGENYMKSKFEYTLPTHDYKLLVRAFINSVRELGFHPFRMILALWLEFYPRIKARVYVKHDLGDMCVWDQVATTKKL